jgi:uncharacterized membrane protein YczE
MKSAPYVRGGPAARLASLVGGIALFAFGIVLTLESRLGLSPWDVLNQGIARHTPLSFGEANIVVALGVLLAGWALGARPGLGTVANAVLIGVFVDQYLRIHGLHRLASEPLAARIVLDLGGIALIGVATAFYIGARFGAGPRDSLMLVGAQRTRFRVGVVRAAIEGGALVAGWVLGGTVGVGTVAFALLVGPAVEASFFLLRRSRLAVRPAVRPPGSGLRPETGSAASGWRRRLLRPRPRAGDGTS